MTKPSDEHLVLIGLMGAGKTTTARAVAERLAWPFRDGDEDLQARTGRTAARIADEDGVARLHELEAAVLLDALRSEIPAVITAAGSAVAAPEVRAALPPHATVVWLDLPVDDLVRRMASADHRRPLDRNEVARLVALREPLLRDLADLRLDARRPTAELVEHIVEHLHTTPHADAAGA